MRFLSKKTEIIPNLFITNSGSRKKKVFSPLYDGKKMSLVESGEIDIQDQINAHAAECDMSLILTRLRNGDMSALNPNAPIYADFRNLPTNFREVLDVALSAERVFNTLPVDVRKQFDNDYRQFVATAGSKEWNSIMSIPNSSPDPVVPTPGSSGSGTIVNPDVIKDPVVSEV